MKVKVPPLSPRKMEQVRKDVVRSVDSYVHDRELMAGCRAQWMLLLALVEVFDFRKKRINKLYAWLDRELPELREFKRLDALDEILISRLEGIDIDIRNSHPEYWDAKKRLDEMEKENGASAGTKAPKMTPQKK